MVENSWGRDLIAISGLHCTPTHVHVLPVAHILHVYTNYGENGRREGDTHKPRGGGRGREGGRTLKLFYFIYDASGSRKVKTVVVESPMHVWHLWHEVERSPSRHVWKSRREGFLGSSENWHSKEVLRSSLRSSSEWVQLWSLVFGHCEPFDIAASGNARCSSFSQATLDIPV